MTGPLFTFNAEAVRSFVQRCLDLGDDPAAGSEKQVGVGLPAGWDPLDDGCDPYLLPLFIFEAAGNNAITSRGPESAIRLEIDRDGNGTRCQ